MAERARATANGRVDQMRSLRALYGPDDPPQKRRSPDAGNVEASNNRSRAPKLISSRKLPPYGRSARTHDGDIFMVFAGARAWDRAASQRRDGDTCAVVLPSDTRAADLDWTFARGRDVIAVWDPDYPGNSAAKLELRDALLRDGVREMFAPHIYVDGTRAALDFAQGDRET